MQSTTLYPTTLVNQANKVIIRIPLSTIILPIIGNKKSLMEYWS